jgi:hypothetical protein
MAETAGIVQRLTLIPESALACVWIGPSPANTEALFVKREDNDPPGDAALKISIIDALSAALVSRHEIVAIHGDEDARITSLRIDPV